LHDWQMMTKPTKSQVDAAGTLQTLINDYRPDIVITEKSTGDAGTLSAAASLKEALIRAAAQNYVLDVSVPRTVEYANKIEEAGALAELYPDVKPWVPPKRRAFDHHPARLILFDALALAHQVLKRPTITLAAAMS